MWWNVFCFTASGTHWIRYLHPLETPKLLRKTAPHFARFDQKLWFSHGLLGLGFRIGVCLGLPWVRLDLGTRQETGCYIHRGCNTWLQYTDKWQYNWSTVCVGRHVGTLTRTWQSTSMNWDVTVSWMQQRQASPAKSLECILALSYHMPFDVKTINDLLHILVYRVAFMWCWLCLV